MNQIKHILSSLFEPLTKLRHMRTLSQNYNDFDLYHCCTHRYCDFK